MIGKLIIKCEKCEGWSNDVSKDVVLLVKEGMTCNCGGTLIIKVKFEKQIDILEMINKR